MVKRKSLGRGLEALLGSSSAASTATPTESAAAAAPPATETLRELPVDLLQRGRYQPRVDMREETLAELAESIRVQGVIQPIVVRPLPHTDGAEMRYEIVAGERRWRAAQLAGLERIPSVIRQIPDETAVAVSLIENIQRENLNPLEEARALRRLAEEFGLSHSDAAAAVGRSRSSVSNLLRLLELPDEVCACIERRELDMGHARALLGLPNAALQTEMASRAIKLGWSVRETERAVRGATSGGQSRDPSKAGRSADPNTHRLEMELAEVLGAPVAILHGARGGRIVIRYAGLEELEGILAHFRNETAEGAY